MHKVLRLLELNQGHLGLEPESANYQIAKDRHVLFFLFYLLPFDLQVKAFFKSINSMSSVFEYA